MSIKFLSVPSKRLSASMTAATMTLKVDNILGWDGNALTAADFGTVAYAVLRNDANTEMEIIEIDPATIADASITILKRGLKFDGDLSTEVSGNKLTWVKNETIVELGTDVPQLFTHFATLPGTIEELGDFKDAVANFAALPAGETNGETRVTLDDSKIYVWSTDDSAWHLAGAGGGAGTVYVTTKLGTESDGDDNVTFSLSSGSFPADKYLQVYVNGILMENGASADYTTTGGNTVVFNSAVLDTDKITMIVISVDIVASNWGVVDADILPTDDNLHSLGSAAKSFKNIFVKNTTSGTATSDTNKVVDEADVASAKTANKIARRDANGDVLVSTTPTSGDAAASKTYVDGFAPITKCGTFSKNAADAPTTLNIAHGLGKIPKKVKLTARSGNATWAEAVYNGTTQTSISYYQTASSYAQSADFILNYGANAAWYTYGAITFDATNIIITWTQSGSPQGTYIVLWEASI